MAISGYPVSTGDDVQKFDFAYQYAKGAFERAQAANGCLAPRSSNVWASGTITAATATTVSTDQTWCGGTDDTSGLTYTVPWICETHAVPIAPLSWRLIIDDNDPSKVVIRPVVSWTNTGTVTFASIQDYVTSGEIPSLASLVGKSFYIIRGDYGLWWSQEIWPWINAKTYAEGTVKTLASGKDFGGNTLPASPSHTIIRVKHGNWVESAFVGKDLLVYADDGLLKRVAITANTSDVITFGTQTWTPAVDSAFCVVDTGARAIPGRNPFLLYGYYLGIREGYYSHDPSDTTDISSINMPASTIHIAGAGPSDDCSGYDLPAFDTFQWTAVDPSDDDLACGYPPDKPLASQLYWTIHGIDALIDDITDAYVEAKSYDGASGIPLLSVADRNKLAGVNAWSGTTGDVEGTGGIGSSASPGDANNAIAVSITYPSGVIYPIQVYYSVHKPDGTTFGDWNTGRGILTSATRLLSESSDLVFDQADPSATPPLPGDNARTIVVTPLFTRYCDREFMRMFDIAGVFTPDVQTDPFTGVQTPVDPGEPVNFSDSGIFGIGKYRKLGKSTNYIERKQEAQDWSTAQGFAREDGEAFQTNEYARFLGDDYYSPSTIAVNLMKTSGSNVDRDYWDRFYVGKLKPAYQHARNEQRGGSATEDSGTFYIKTDKDWFDMQWFGGIMRTESGTADSGSTTSLTDSSKAESDQASPTNALNSPWNPYKWSDYGDAYVGFTVEIDLDDGHGGTITYQRLITASTATAVSISWAEALPSTADGRPYRIKEPYYLNRWKDRTVKIVSTNPTTGELETITATVTGNSADTLFFSPAMSWPIKKGDRFVIDDPQTGTVWKWNGSKWIVPSGSDTNRIGVPTGVTPQDFKANQTCNKPTQVKRYGRMMPGDNVDHPLFWNERFAVLNVLRWTRNGADWDAASSAGGTPDNNHKLGQSAGQKSNFSDERDNAKGLYSGATADSVNGPPFALVQATDDGDPDCTSYYIERQYAYPKTTDEMCIRESHSVAFYAYAIPQPPGTGTSTFNSEGDPVDNGLWSAVGGGDHGPTTSAGPVYGSQVGSLSTPADVGDPPNPPDELVEGYQINAQCSIIKWDVAGGFQIIS